MPAKSRKNLYEHYRGNEEFVKRMCDLCDRMEHSYRIVYTSFLTSAQQSICTKLFGNSLHYQFFGGYEGAEYQCAAFIPEHSDEVLRMPIVCLKGIFPLKYGSLNHRDVLGALMNTGIKREHTGDILIQEDTVYIFCMEDIATYIIQNLTKIKRFSIAFEVVDEQLQKYVDIQYVQEIITSLRLDCLIASICHIPRTKAQLLITSGQVKVDHLILEETSYLCNNNSVISIRGYGRFVFKEVIKTTKKDRLVVEIGKYV